MNMESLQNKDDILLPEDLQEIFHLSRSTVYGLLRDGAIESIKIGKLYRIPKENVIKFVESNNNRW